jgi:protoheme IX farnesyltransferase
MTTFTATTSRTMDVVRAYLALTKPRIIELLLVTTLPTMIVAADGVPDLVLTVATVCAGAGAAAGANALNCYVDRDADVMMRRTRNQPLPSGAVGASKALRFGVALSVLSVAVMAVATTVIAAILTGAAIVTYVLGYSVLLKRRTPQNIVWGGVAGCMPVLIGWSAVTGGLSWTPIALFLVVFFWTPPHFWALAMRYRDDYANAGIPMLPAVAPARRVTTLIVRYTWATAGVSVLVWPLATSWLYGATAIVLGGISVAHAQTLHRAVVRGAQTRPMRLFHWSISYLALLFSALVVDTLAL